MTEALEEQMKERRLDWLLRERVGGETPPDLTEGVLAQLDDPPRSVRRALLVAAVVLIGVAVVVAVALQSPAEPVVVEPEVIVQPQDPKNDAAEPVRVSNRKDIEALPEDTRAVVCVNCTDEDLQALSRLQQLRDVELTVSRYVNPTGHAPPAEDVYVTDAGLGQLAALPRLSKLSLVGQLGIVGPGLLGLVARSPMTSLRCQSMDVSDVTLVGLSKSAIRDLSLAGSQGFGSKGLRAIGTYPLLRRLSLRGCTHLESEAIMQLSALQTLQELDLSMIGSYTIFWGFRVSPLPELSPGSGVTDEVLQALAELPRVKVLDLDQADVSDQGLRALAGWSKLETLTLTGLDDITALGIAELPTSLRHLILRGHQSMTDELLQALVVRPGLATCKLGHCRPTGSRVIEILESAPPMTIDLTGWSFSAAERERLRGFDAKIHFGDGR